MPIKHQTSEPTVFDRTYLIERPESVPLVSSVYPTTDTAIPRFRQSGCRKIRLPDQLFDLCRIDTDTRPHGRGNGDGLNICTFAYSRF